MITRWTSSLSVTKTRPFGGSAERACRKAPAVISIPPARRSAAVLRAVRHRSPPDLIGRDIRARGSKPQNIVPPFHFPTARIVPHSTPPEPVKLISFPRSLNVILRTNRAPNYVDQRCLWLNHGGRCRRRQGNRRR